MQGAEEEKSKFIHFAEVLPNNKRTAVIMADRKQKEEEKAEREKRAKELAEAEAKGRLKKEREAQRARDLRDQQA